jgi:predicted naringenin-chalcone synthase
LHFQKEYNADSASSSLLFADGAAAVLINNQPTENSLTIEGFHSHIALQGKQDMAWEINTKGFLMRLSSYIPQLIEADIAGILAEVKKKYLPIGEEIKYWCIHPGGKKIVDLIQKKLALTDAHTSYSRKILEQFGNMSSPTILFVLKEIMQEPLKIGDTVFGVAFGPGLTMETFIARKNPISHP